jgi:hypothetical protein
MSDQGNDYRAPAHELENPAELEQLKNWFSYHPPVEEQVALYTAVREAGLVLGRAIMLCCPPSADRSAALRKAREAVMTANAAIACGGK